MDLDRIKELLQVVADSGVAELEIEEDDVRVVIRRASPPVVTVVPTAGYAPVGSAVGEATAGTPAGNDSSFDQSASGSSNDVAVADDLIEVRAPIVGTFYGAASPDAEPFVAVGDSVAPGDVLCIIEAMKLMNEIECEQAGTIREIEVSDAQAVEYDQVLFRIEAA